MKSIYVLVLISFLSYSVFSSDACKVYTGDDLVVSYCINSDDFESCLESVGFYDKSLTREMIMIAIGIAAGKITDAMIERVRRYWNDPKHLPQIINQMRREVREAEEREKREKRERERESRRERDFDRLRDRIENNARAGTLA